jgi:hypothetical protein
MSTASWSMITVFAPLLSILIVMDMMQMMMDRMPPAPAKK